MQLSPPLKDAACHGEHCAAVFDEQNIQSAPLGPPYHENGAVQHASPPGQDAHVDYEEVQNLSDMPGMRVPLVFDPRWPQRQGGHMGFRFSTPDTHEESARRDAPLHQRAGAAPPPAELDRGQRWPAQDTMSELMAQIVATGNSSERLSMHAVHASGPRGAERAFWGSVGSVCSRRTKRCTH